ncbi:MAG: hypothetical protein R3C27_03755 [Hyphomonadaceae bacterium]
MPGWIIAAAVATVAITAILTFVLWRMNAQPAQAGGKRSTRADGGEGDSAAGMWTHSGSRRDSDHSSDHDGGGDGGK